MIRIGIPLRWATSGAIALAVFANLGCTSPSGGKKATLSQRLKKSLQSTLSDSYHDDDAEKKLATAETLFEKKDFESAQKLYADVAANTYNPAAMIERSRFMEGECLRERRHFPAAVDAYHRMLQDFPAGVYSERAAGHMYQIAEVWLQDVLGDFDAKKAKASKARQFRFPNPFDHTRPFLDQEGELVKTLENVVNGCPTAAFADKAMFWAGYLHFINSRFEEADHYFSQLVEMHKDSPLRQEALKYAVMAKNNSTGGAVYDGQKSAEALQLVHHIEATDTRYIQDKEKSAWLTRQKMAIRIQQAEKDFEQAEYYKRIDHLGSAFFYYDMVIRRYPGTKYSDQAQERLKELEALKKTRKTSSNSGSASPFDKLFGRKDPDADPPPPDPTPDRKPTAGPKDAPPRIVPQGFGNQR